MLMSLSFRAVEEHHWTYKMGMENEMKQNAEHEEALEPSDKLRIIRCH